MVDGDSGLDTGIQVIAGAVISENQQLLVVRRRGDEHWALPGGPVVPGEPIESSLRRRLNNELDASVTFVSFLAVVEHGSSARSPDDHHELILVFDVGLRDASVELKSDHLEVRRIPWVDLATVDLRPAALGDGLLSRRLDEDQWVPWRAS